MKGENQPALWIKLTLGDEGQVGPGKIELLRRIGEHHSIAAAARSMDMSYRRAWLLVDELNRQFSRPVVEKWQGGRSQGGASLSRLGVRLIETYDEMLRRTQDVNADLLRDVRRMTGKRTKLRTPHA
jgi:molybdate transport system regulatory protein